MGLEQTQSRISFRQALAWTGLAVLTVLLTLALLLGVTLWRASRLLDELSRSQAQLAQAAQLQADLSDYAALRTPESIVQVRSRLAGYRRSVAEEGRTLGPASARHQAIETARADRIAQIFDGIAADTGGSARGLAELRGFIELVQNGEQAEGEESLAAMRRLREGAFGLAAAATLLTILAGAVGFALMSARVLRPLQRLEQAADELGRHAGEPVRPGGFAEFERLGEAFNRMATQIAGQRRALFEANRDLEGQVRSRTREIEDSRAQLTQVDAARRLFLSKVSHELRTPATVMRGEAEVALRDPATDGPRLREALQHVAANAAFLQRRLDDLLALARADDGRLKLWLEPVDLAALARRVAVLADSYVRSSEVVLEVDIPDDARLTALADTSWLQQTLLALLDNAAKFAAGTRVRLSLAESAGWAVFVVADGGPGVDSADLPHLFDNYYQAPAGPARGGAGLGLSVARWVVEQHGGAISASCPPGEGLRVEIRLPPVAGDERA